VNISSHHTHYVKYDNPADVSLSNFVRMVTALFYISVLVFITDMLCVLVQVHIDLKNQMCAGKLTLVAIQLLSPSVQTHILLHIRITKSEIIEI
jgi:hypothetical protein